MLTMCVSDSHPSHFAVPLTVGGSQWSPTRITVAERGWSVEEHSGPSTAAIAGSVVGHSVGDVSEVLALIKLGVNGHCVSPARTTGASGRSGRCFLVRNNPAIGVGVSEVLVLIRLGVNGHCVSPARTTGASECSGRCFLEEASSATLTLKASLMSPDLIWLHSDSI